MRARETTRRFYCAPEDVAESVRRENFTFTTVCVGMQSGTSTRRRWITDRRCGGKKPTTTKISSTRRSIKQGGEGRPTLSSVERWRTDTYERHAAATVVTTTPRRGRVRDTAQCDGGGVTHVVKEWRTAFGRTVGRRVERYARARLLSSAHAVRAAVDGRPL